MNGTVLHSNPALPSSPADNLASEGLASSSNERPSDASSARGTDTRTEVPQFGAVDIVEAFTAMRHEWRGQTKETRAVAEQIQAAVTSLQSLETRIISGVTRSRPDENGEARPLVLLVVETDHQLTRAVEAIAQWEETRRQRERESARSVQQCIAGMSGIARWFAAPLLAVLASQPDATAATPENAALDGLKMVLARLRRLMRDQGIDRFDVLGQPFDAELMCAIGTVESPDYPAGNVAEQLSAAYRWQGRLLKFADVRVAN